MPLTSRVAIRRHLALALAALLAAGAAQADSYTYSGRLDEFGTPVTGRYDLRLAVHADAIHGSTVVTPITFSAVEVVDGAFRVDFDLPPGHDQAWVELSIRPAGSVDWVALPGRTKALLAPEAIGQCWSTTGDSGSNPATNFIGTTDAQAFTVRTANARSLRIEPSSLTFGTPALPITTNTIGGSHANTVTSGVRGATIAGGGVPTGNSDPDLSGEAPNQVTDHYGTVGGGYANRAGDAAGTTTDGAFATVGGGVGNTASGGGSTVVGGQSNTAGGGTSTVGGGLVNNASGFASTVGGGFGNTASGESSNVGGGDSNTASGERSTVGGGVNNCAGGNFSWAGGFRAKVRPGTGPASGSCAGLPSYPGGGGDAGTFVWADSQSSSFVSTGNNQFLVRAAGGAVFTGNSAVNDPAGNRLRVDGTLRVDTLGTAAATTLCRNASNQISGCSSSARYKSDIADLELGLETALRLHAVGYRWKNTGDADIGFVAEEIAAIDERLVTRNDQGAVEGVKYERLTAVLANAVQELAARESIAGETLTRIDAENAALRAELERRDAEYRSRLDRLEALLADRGHESR